MKSDDEMMDELRRMTRQELERCGREMWPLVCRMGATAEGRRKLEAAVMRMALEDGIPAGAAIAQIESELERAGHEE